MRLETLTALSTSAIVLSAVLLLLGWYFIRGKGNVTRHKNAMLGATVSAGLFLVFYVTRWALYGSKSFEGEGFWRTLYFANLIPHILFAMTVGPLALYLIYLALVKEDFVRHRRWARVTLPIWLYVAASGWLIYWMLYKLPV